MRLHSLFLLLTVGISPITVQLIACGSDEKKKKDKDKDDDKDEDEDEDKDEDEDEDEDDADPKDSVSVENVCAKFMERADEDEDWAEWAEEKDAEEGSCEDSIGESAEEWDKEFPEFEGQFLGTFDRCLDENEALEDFQSCMDTEMGALMEKVQQMDMPQGEEVEEAAEEEAAEEEAAEEEAAEEEAAEATPKGPPAAKGNHKRGGKGGKKR